MRSTFMGLTTAYKGLSAQQRALDITGHNVANANTEGYTRQDVIMQASSALKVLEGYVGTGVDIGEFRRIRDEFLDIQMRTENKALGEWEVKSDILDKLEVIFNEPSDTALRSVLDQFWEAWQVLAKNPEGVAARTTVVQRGISLANTFNHLAAQFIDLQADINKSIEVKVNEINSQARQIRDLNAQIIKAEASGKKANDLRDRRDLILEQLAKNIAIDVVEDDLGAVNVTVGGRFLVSRTELATLKFTDDFSDPTQAKLEWCDPFTGAPQGTLRANGGILKGYLDMRDEVIVQYHQQISELAKTIAEKTNELHGEGYGLDGSTELDLFVKLDIQSDFSAGNIEVNQEIIDDLNKLATGLGVWDEDAEEMVSYQGDGSNALRIAQLKHALIMTDGLASFDDFYRSLIGQLGIQGQEAFQMVENRSSLVEQLQNRRASVSGVSLDEEMVNMIRFQHAYSAAARVLNVMDEMLDTVVNRLGLAGR